MSNNIILELAEQGKNTLKHSNGDYTVTFQQPVEISKNDITSVKMAVIDAVDNSDGKINIQPRNEGDTTLELSLTFGYYYLDYGSTFEDTFNSKTFEDFGGASSSPSGRVYACNQGVGTPTVNSKKVTSFTIKLNPKTASTGLPDGNLISLIPILIDKPNTPGNTNNQLQLDYEFIWTDTTGKDTPWHKYLNDDYTLLLNKNTVQQMINDKVLLSVYNDDPFNFAVDFTKADIADNFQFKDINVITGFKPSGVDIGFGFQNITVEDYGGNDTQNILYTNTITIDIDVGTYEPDDLAHILSDKLSDLELNGKVSNNPAFMTSNPILKTVRQVLIQNGGTLDDTPQFFLVDSDDTKHGKFTFNTPVNEAPNTFNYYFGSSELGITYNEENDKMEIAQMHSSLFSSDLTGNPQALKETRFIRNDTAGFEEKFLINKSSGIFFTSLEPREFWIGPSSKMKFDKSLLVGVKSKSVDDPGTPGAVIHYEVPEFLTDKINITGDDNGVDNIIIKKPDATNQRAFDVVPTITEAEPLITNISQTLGIMGGNTLHNDSNVGTDSGGYFKIEVDLDGIKSNVLEQNENKNNKIQSIISRYYNTAQYTTAYNEGSMPLQYTSDIPSYISQARIRILNPNGTLADNLGDTSSIILEIQKATN